MCNFYAPFLILMVFSGNSPLSGYWDAAQDCPFSRKNRQTALFETFYY